MLDKLGIGIVVEVDVGVRDATTVVVVLLASRGRVVGLEIIVASILAWIATSRSGVGARDGPDSSSIPQLTSNISAGVSRNSDTYFKSNYSLSL